MKWIFGTSAMWLFATVAVAAVAFAAGQQLPEGEGKQVVTDACGSCHSLEPITKQELDKDGWKDIVQRMIANGASIDDKQVPLITDYLAKNFGPKNSGAAAQGGGGGGLPDGEGKQILQNVCTTCHDLDLVTGTQASKEGWEDIVKSMNAKGAGLSDKDTLVLVDYLSKAFPAKK